MTVRANTLLLAATLVVVACCVGVHSAYSQSFTVVLHPSCSIDILPGSPFYPDPDLGSYQEQVSENSALLRASWGPLFDADFYQNEFGEEVMPPDADCVCELLQYSVSGADLFQSAISNLFDSDCFGVVNNAPTVATVIPAFTLEADGIAVPLNLTVYFADPEEGTLTYEASSSDPAVTGVDIDGSTLRVTGVAAGVATITVTASDAEGLSASQTTNVTVVATNVAPTVAALIPALILEVDGDAVEQNLAAHFADPEGEALTYKSSSSDTSVATVSVSDGEVTVTGVAAGVATLTVTATDPEGLSASQTINVTVVATNAAPTVAAVIPALILEVNGDAVEQDLAVHFTDPDGDGLTYEASSSDLAVATGELDGSTLRVRGVAAGVATITVEASDADGLTVETTFQVTVHAMQATNEVMDLGDITTVTSAQTISGRIDGSADADFFRFRIGESGRIAITSVGYESQVFSADVDMAVCRSFSSDCQDFGSYNVSFYGNSTLLFPSAEEPLPPGEYYFRVAGISGFGPGTYQYAYSFRPEVGILESIADQRVAVGSQVSMDVSGNFTGPVGSLTYSVSSSDVSVATASVFGSDVTVVGIAEGAATITVTATDPEGVSASQTVSVTVVPENSAPTVAAEILDLTLEVDGDTVEQNLAAHFTDPDGDALTYNATSSDAARVAVDVDGSMLRVTAIAIGLATITVAATDADGLTAETTFEVEVTLMAPHVDQQTREVVEETVETVVTSTLSNVTTNIGTRFSAARGGTAVTVAGLPVSFENAASALVAFNDGSDPALHGGLGDDLRDQYLTLDRLLQTSAFQVSLAAADAETEAAGPGPSLTLWGRVDSMFFDKESGDSSRYDGDLKAGYLGIDTWLDDRWLIGVATSVTKVDADYGLATGGGRLDLSILGVHPYVRLALDDVSELWLILGWSRGKLQNLSAARSTREDTDVTMYMGAAGMRRELTSLGGVDIAVLGDAGLGSLRGGRVSGVSVIDNLSADAWRARLGFSGSHTIVLEDLATFTPFVEVVGRYDGGGDGNAGLEIAGGIQYANPASGLGLEFRANVLPLYSEDDYREYGFSLSASASPGIGGEGLAMAVATSLGTQTGSGAALWRENLLATVNAPDNLAESLMVNAEIGYGFPVVGSKGVLTPFSGFRLRNGGGQQMRTGVRFGRMTSIRPWNLELSGEQHTSDVRDAEYRLNLLGRVRF